MNKVQEAKRTLTPQQVEAIYGIPVGTLCQMRYRRRGPKYYVLGNPSGKRRKILYFVSDVEAWIKANPVITTDGLEISGQKRR